MNDKKWIVAQLSDKAPQWACTFYVAALVNKRKAKGMRHFGTGVYDTYEQCKKACDKWNRKTTCHLEED
jgi:hypothetical protein